MTPSRERADAGTRRGAPLTRSFLACWPEASVAEALHRCTQQLVRQVGGRVVSRDNLHITLVFLGDLAPPQLDAVAACCRPLPAPFPVTLDRLGYWRARGIVWAGSRTPDPGLGAFVEDLRDRLRRVGFRIESRAFVPHITLLRKARRRPRMFLENLDWTITDYTLTASEMGPEGSAYSVLTRWSTVGDVE